jgi:hypothetical protein
MEAEINNSQTLMIPKVLYGPLGQAGKGWQRIATAAWNQGWQMALADIEWIDLLKSPGLIITARAPSGMLYPHLKQEPFVAAYMIHAKLTKVADKNCACDQPSAWFRLRDLALEAFNWPWYCLGQLSPEIRFMPLTSKPFPTDQAWQEEKQKCGRERLRRMMQHFKLFAQLDPWITSNGMGWIDQLGPRPKGWLGMLGGGIDMPSEMLYDIVCKLSPKDAERQIYTWMKANGIEPLPVPLDIGPN